MPKSQKSWLIPVVAIIALAFQNCSGAQNSTVTASGTFTGNADAPAVIAASLIANACSALVACQPTVDVNACRATLLQSSPLTVGVPVNTGLVTFSSLENAESDGLLGSYGLQSDVTEMLACNSEISKVSCSSPLMTSAAISGIFALGSDCSKTYQP